MSGAIDSSGLPGPTSTTQQSHAGSISRNKQTTKSKQICRFFNSKKGCRAGDQCPYAHIKQDVPVANVAEPSSTKVSRSPTTGQHSQPSRQDVSKSRPTGRPTSLLEQSNPREFQIKQVVRRFSPFRADLDNHTTLKFKLQPSDPDFPFELDGLKCVLTVPNDYPQTGKPLLKVENAEMARGFQINVERGFDSLVVQHPNKSLLALLNDLDKNLEQFLASEKAQTIKIVANIPRPTPRPPSPKPLIPEVEVNIPAPISYTTEQKAIARQRRDVEIRQLEARMGRLPLFVKSQDGLAFTLPVQIAKSSRLPLSLQSVKEATLTVPSLYPLELCTIKLKGVSGVEAENVEVAFEKHTGDDRALTLMARFNYLIQNMHTMAHQEVLSKMVDMQTATGAIPDEPVDDTTPKEKDTVFDPDRPHLKFIERPPEWNQPRDEGDASESDSTSEDDDYSSDDDDDRTDTDNDETTGNAGGASIGVASSSTPAETGVMLSFPHLELHSIELLTLPSISLTIKCERCKTQTDLTNIKASDPNSGTSILRVESCHKCAASLSVRFRAELLHANSIKAGFLDLEGCNIVDMLPSAFLPTCADCSTTYPLPGLTAVRGDSTLGVCRSCHAKFSFLIPETKFLRISNNPSLANGPQFPLRRKKENLGITAGTPLPLNGKCKHYSKSYRWFRFSCCGKVYPCDRCHDEAEKTHANEHANRMICGWCSREQNYRPEDCGTCRRSVVKKNTVGGFWEGGKGTRDKARMSRKEKRKYKKG